MTDIISRLRLVVDSSGVDRAGRSLRDLRNDARNLDTMAGRLRNAFSGLAAVVGTAFSAGIIIQYADAWKRAENQIKTVEKSLMGVKAAQEGVFAVAQKTYSAYDATATLYTKLTRAGGGLIAGQKEALRLVETVNKALAVGGASSSERNSVILQLGQAVGSGRLQGDEFRSISENAPLLLDALAKSTGKARGELKALGSEGKITTEVLIKAMKEYGDEVDKTFAKFSPSMADAFNNLQNAFQKVVGQNGAPVFNAIAAATEALAKNLDVVAKAAIAAGTAFAAVFIGRGISGAITAFTAFRASMALTNAQLTILEARAGMAAGALGRVSIVSVAASGAMRALNGAMAFFGGPIGLAITALSLALGGLAMSAVQASQDMEALKQASASAGQVLDRYNDLLKPASKDTGDLSTRLGEGAIKMTSFAGQTGAAAQSLYEYAKAQRAAALADVRREQSTLQLEIAKNQSRTPQARRADDAELVKSFFGLPSNIKSVGQQFDTLGRVMSGDIESWWTKGESDKKRNAEISKGLQQMQALAEVEVKLMQAPDDVPGFLKGWAPAAAEATKKTKELRTAAADMREGEEALDLLTGGWGDLKDALRSYQNVSEDIRDNPLPLSAELAEQHVALLNATTAFKKYNDEAEAALSGGYDNYQKFLSDKRFEVQFNNTILHMTKEQVDAAKQAYFIEGKRAENFDKMARRAEKLTELSATNQAEDDFFASADRFWFDFLKNGKDALKSFGNSFKDIIIGAFADGLRAAADPFVKWFAAELKSAVSDIFNVVKDSFTSLLKKSGILKAGDDGKLILNADNAIAKLFKAGMTAYAGYQVGQMGANALGMGGKGPVTQQNSQVGSAIGSAIGTAIAGPIGAVIGGFLGGIAGSMFGKESNHTAGANFDASGNMLGGIYGTKRTSETQGALETVINAVDAAKGALKDLGGATSIFVKQLEIGVRDPGWAMLSNGRNLKTAVGDPTALANAVGIELLRATTFSVDALNKIRDGMLGAGKSFDDTVVTLQQVQSVLKSNQPALSEWEQKLKDIDDVFKPLIAATGAYSSALQDAYNAAKGAVVSDYNKDIENQLKGLLNGPADQLNEMLEMQAKRLEEAKKLGANLDQVNRLTALEQRDFFKGLSDDALKEVEGFLGVFDEATNSVVRNLDMSRQDLKSRADTFAGFAEQFSQLNADFTERFLAASPRESIGLLRGRVNELLTGVGQGNESAAQALPQAINKLVDAARASYGNTAGFNDVLTFAQNALMQAKDSALKVQTDAEKQIAALDASNTILADIRDILASSQATNAFFQSYVNGGAASSDALMALIQKGAGLTPANDNASALNITGLIAQSVQPIIAPLASSIDNFTARLSDLPSLQRLTIEHIDRGADRIVAAIDRLDQRMDRIEILNKKQLEELEQANEAA